MTIRPFHDRAGNQISFEEIRDLCVESYKDLEKAKTVLIANQHMNVERSGPGVPFAAFTIQKRNGWRAVVFRGSGTDDYLSFDNPLSILAGLPLMLPLLLSPLLSPPLSLLLQAAQFPAKTNPPPQYSQGVDYVTRYGEKNAILVGHSLGGGIATYVAARLGMHAATIFPVPIHPFWLGPSGPEAGYHIQNYVDRDELVTGLTNITNWYSLRRYGMDVWIKAVGNTRLQRHRHRNVKEIDPNQPSGPSTPTQGPRFLW